MEKALYRILNALIRTLLKSDVDYAAFDRIARKVYVTAAREEFSSGGRKPSISQVALRTGLSRKVVRQLLEEEPDETSDGTRAKAVAYLARIIAIWHTNPAFCDPQTGEPRPITANGADSEFQSLLSCTGRDIPPSAVVRELKKVGAVEETASGHLKVLTRDYLPITRGPEYMTRFGDVLNDVITTLTCNLFWTGEANEMLRESRVTEKIDRKYEREYRLFARVVVEHCTRELDDFLLARARASTDPVAERVRCGHGMYTISDARAEQFGMR